MYICVCNGVTERHIDVAVAAGATSLRDLRECLGVASECGRCARSARVCLQRAAEKEHPARNIGWAGSTVQTFNGPLTFEAEAS